MKKASRPQIALLAALGCVIAAYLALYQIRAVHHVWDPVFGTGSERVLDSAVSRQIRRWTFIPDSALGAIAYLTEIVFALAGRADRARKHPRLVLTFGANSAALAIAALALVALQTLVIHAFCLLCLTSAAISLTIAALAYPEVRVAFASLRSR